MPWPICCLFGHFSCRTSGLTIPYLSLTPVLAVLSGWWVLGEQPGLMGVAGVVVIAVGALVLNPAQTASRVFIRFGH